MWILLHKLLSLPALVRQRARQQWLNSQIDADPSVVLHETSKIANLVGDRHKIRIRANTHIRGELAVFAHGGSISIGSYCYIGEGARIWSADSITIGDRVLISHNVNIHDNNGHPTDAAERHQHFQAIISSGHPSRHLSLRERAIHIGNDVWIGFNATILKGVTIGDRTIIGANTIVTKSVDADCIVTNDIGVKTRPAIGQSAT
jgi:acetyltransferase-like isoleucine patch superfamily enzyme